MDIQPYIYAEAKATFTLLNNFKYWTDIKRTEIVSNME